MKYLDVNSLELVNLIKTYTNNKNIALNNINYIFTPGIYGILGPNGAGKTTLLNIIATTVMQTSGKVLYNNKTTRKLDEKYREILGYMPQQQTLYNHFTGREFLSYMSALKKIPKPNIELEVERVAKLVNIYQDIDKLIASYSGGMKQRLLIANAILGTPQVVVLDEATAGLDPKERANLRNILKELSKTAIILFATHIVSDIENIADTIILMDNGTIIDSGSCNSLIEKYALNQNLEQVYLNVFAN